MSSSSTTYPTSTTRQHGGLLIAGIAGPVLFLAVMLVGILGGRTSGSTPGSGMELGSLGWLMSIVFVVTGACIVAFAIGQYRVLKPASRVGTALLGIAGLGILLSGILVPDAPGAAETAHGQAHNMLFLVTSRGKMPTTRPGSTRWRTAPHRRVHTVHSIPAKEELRWR
jgi:hypothetical protein